MPVFMGVRRSRSSRHVPLEWRSVATFVVAAGTTALGMAALPMVRSSAEIIIATQVSNALAQGDVNRPVLSTVAPTTANKVKNVQLVADRVYPKMSSIVVRHLKIIVRKELSAPGTEKVA
jgi:hypothetical protein